MGWSYETPDSSNLCPHPVLKVTDDLLSAHHDALLLSQNLGHIAVKLVAGLLHLHEPHVSFLQGSLMEAHKNMNTALLKTLTAHMSFEPTLVAPDSGVNLQSLWTLNSLSLMFSNLKVEHHSLRGIIQLLQVVPHLIHFPLGNITFLLHRQLLKLFLGHCSCSGGLPCTALWLHGSTPRRIRLCP